MQTFIAIPCGETLPVQTVQSFTYMNKPGDHAIGFLSGSLVYDARNKLSDAALQSDAEYVLWLDSDMTMEKDMMERFLEDMKEHDIVCGLFFMRRPPFTPCIYSKIKVNEAGLITDNAKYEDYPLNDIFEVQACGFGAVMMKTKVLREMVDRYHTCFTPLPGCGEDIAFCIRAKSLGYKIMCDSKIKLGHVSHAIMNEETYRQLRGNTYDNDK